MPKSGHYARQGWCLLEAAPLTRWVLSCPGWKWGVPGSAVLYPGANGCKCSSQFDCPWLENNVHGLIKMLRRNWESDRWADSRGTQWETKQPTGTAGWMVMGPALGHSRREQSSDSLSWCQGAPSYTSPAREWDWYQGVWLTAGKGCLSHPL